MHIYTLRVIVCIENVMRGETMRVAMIGGDERMLYAADGLTQEGALVSLSGFDKTSDIRNIDHLTAVRWADIVVLPVKPFSVDSVNAPFSANVIDIESLAEAVGDKPVFSGFGNEASKYFSKVYDYTAREDFAIRNAALTAEGALAALISERKRSLFGSKILVLGFGRIGKVLSRYLKAIGAEVTVAVRRSDAKAWAEAEGFKTCDYSLEEINVFGVIINTVPSLVLTGSVVNRLSKDAFILDLASGDGGADKDAVNRRGIKLVHALGLPGKTAPMTAGTIIKDSIISIIKEENGGKDNFGLRDDRLLLHL